MKIGILGGTFDPVHSGHIALAKSALRELHLQQLYFVPAKKSPFKVHPPVAAEKKRVAMLRNALRQLPSAKISLVELHRPAPSYTISTIRTFAQRFAKDQLFLVMGSDTLAHFHRWKKWREILGFCKLAVAERDGFPIHQTVAWQNAAGKIVSLKTPMPKLSSTHLRLEQKILVYLKNSLPHARVQHVLNVMQLTEKLSQKHGTPTEKAKLAASLHDLARCWSDKKLIRYVHRHRLKIPGKEWSIQHQPLLLHSYVSANLARTRFCIRDREILSAIEKHTLGDFTMTPLDKVLFLADLTSKERNFSGVQKLRKLAFASLDRAFLEGLRFKMEYLVRSKSLIHPRAVQVWNYFLRDDK